MKKLAFGLLALTLLSLGCKKDNPPVENPNLLELTFIGTVTDAITQSPVANVPVYIVYGTMCCAASR